jgi:hypothetical protein
MTDEDSAFFSRADAHIDLSNEHIAGDVGRGKVSASMMYATARFCAWVSACACESKEDMEALKSENLQYFVEQFRLMLEENLNDYTFNFERYMATPANDA